MSIHRYEENSDFDKAFKNLLQPIESITKKDSCEIMQYDLVTELDSYLNHLKKCPNSSATMFTEAAIIIQNIALIYQKKIDVTISGMMKLVEKFRSYKLNRNIDPDYCTDKRIENKIKKNSKKVKCYSFFGPIESQIGTMKNFDCKQIDLRKLPLVKKIVLNTNIKVDNKYSKILPYICNANKEKIGKKYDYKINFPLDCDLAASEEFYFPTKEDSTSKNLINYRNNTNSLPMNLLDADKILQTAFNSMIIDQKVIDEFNICCKMSSNSNHLLNVSQIPQNDNDPSAQVLKAKRKSYANKSRMKKKDLRIKDQNKKSSMHMNGTEFHSLIHDEEMEELLKIDESNENVQTYQRNAIDMQNYEAIIMEKMNERLEMERRVVEWHDKLKPILEEEEKMVEFDIHEYGTRILSCFESIGEQKSFTDLVGGLDAVEVSRYFLSLLMMINTNNFEISNHISGEEFLIKLLKKDRHHEELQVNIGNQMVQDL